MMYNYITIFIEIIFFVYIAYAIITLLGKDKRCNMVGYFVLYLVILVLTHECAFLTIHYFLYWMSPCFALLFMFFQQDQLQKNFVTITHTPSDTELQPTANLITTLLQIGLHNSLNNKKSFFIIEGNEDLSLLLSSSIPLNIVLQKKLIEMLCDSSLYDEQLALWIKYTGIIRGINTDLIQNTNRESFDMLPKKTDCLILYCNKNSMWSIKQENNLYEELNTIQAHKIAIKTIDSLFQKKGIRHAQHNKKHSTNQPYS